MPSIIRKEEGEGHSVLDYAPKKIEKRVTTQAKQFVRRQTEEALSPVFKINDLAAEQSGVREIERLSTEKKIERRALERLKTVQEKAYAEAYELGMEEGNKKAYEDAGEEIATRLDRLASIVKSLTVMKEEVFGQNEAQLMDMVFFLGRQIAMDQIKENPERILPVLKQCLQSAQADENVEVRISTEDYQFLMDLKQRVDRSFEDLDKIKFQSDENMQLGSCIIETNYGVIDASVEERIEKLWKVLAEKKPKRKDRIE